MAMQTTRRVALLGAAAVAAPVLPVVAAPPALVETMILDAAFAPSPGPDAELLAMCADWHMRQAELDGYHRGIGAGLSGADLHSAHRAAEPEFDRLCATHCRLEGSIAARCALTRAGMIAKARIAAHSASGKEMAHSVVSDLLAFDGAA